MLKMATLASSPHDQLSIPAINCIKSKGCVEAYFGSVYREGTAAKASLQEMEDGLAQAVAAQE